MSSIENTHSQILSIPHEPCWKHIQQTIHTQIYKLRELNKITLARKEARNRNPKQSSEKEYESIPALASFVVISRGYLGYGCEAHFCGFGGRPFSSWFAQQSIAEGGHYYFGMERRARGRSLEERKRNLKHDDDGM
jgi:hypothetical protein